MGVKFAKEYQDIHQEMVDALLNVKKINEFFNMEPEGWNGMDEAEKNACIQTLADDIFFALGEEKTLTVGASIFQYDMNHHIIKVSDGEKDTIIDLV